MANWWKIAVTTFQQILVAFSSYEYGKNSELEDHQKLVIAKSIENTRTSEISENFDSLNSVWIVIGLIAFATTLYIINELQNVIGCKRQRNSGEQIELQNIRVQPRAAVRNIPVQNHNVQADVHVDA